jgi:uncharacterized protein
VTLVDASVLLYAVNEDAEHHTTARSWLTGELRGTRTVGLSWVALLAFLRLSTKVGLFPSPLTVDQATGQVRRWLDHPRTVRLAPTARHADVLAGLLAGVGAGGNLVNDAHLAALAVEHAATIVTFDSDFGRFPGVQWVRPVAP